VKINGLILLVLLLAFNHAVKAQTVTDPWASMGGSTTPSLIAIDASNNLYVTNFSNSTISKITPAGTVTQAWATLAANTYPYGIAIDASGNLYTANRGPKTISKITPSGDGTSGSVIQTWANLGGDEAYTLAIDASGIVYVPYVSTNRIAKITPNGATGTINTAWVTLASGANPFSISFDASGNLYSANSNNTISKITPAGVVTQAWATLAASSNPQFMVFDPTGNLYVSCWGTSTVSKINTSGTVTDNWSLGTNVWTAGIVLDGAGNVYTTNHNNHTISKITPTGTVTQAYVTLANGANPFHLVKDASGNMYTTNMGNHTLSKISVPSVSITSSASGAVCAGTSVTFTAVASTISSPTYQWYKNGTAISGESNATYTTSSLANADQIYVTVTPGYTSGSISTSNLIANFDAANYNTSSTRWNDLSASANHMDFYTSNSYSTLKTANYLADGGGSFNVNNNSLYGKTINNTGISGNGGKTMTAWVKFDAADRDWTSIASIGTYNNYAVLFEIFASRNGSGHQIMLVFAGGVVVGTTTIPLNTWANVTIKADGSSLKVFVNGILDGTGNQTLNTTNSPLYLGAPVSYSNGGWDNNLRGRISTLSLYNAALSDQTILDNYNATKGRYTAVPGFTSNTLVSSINAAPATPTITVTGDACANKTTLTTSTGLGTYVWYKDNVVIPSATTNTYTPTASGVYKVTVSNGSCTSTSSTTTINECGRTSDGSMVVVEGSSTLISRDGSKNTGKGVDDRGKILTKPWTYGTVTTATGRVWLDRNLGASRVATSSTDTQAYGDYYQWGRPADGHQMKYLTNNNSTGFTNTKSATAVPATDLWIEPIDGSNDWLSTPDNTLWTGANPATNPCPAGFRIPTESEWSAERATWSSTNAAGGFASPLKLTRPGMLTSFGSSGAYFTAKDNFGQYLTQTAYTNGGARYFGIEGSNAWFDQNYYKSHGMSVRCIQNQ
jgi:uncharacterized protein (TIGR02145 family)